MSHLLIKNQTGRIVQRIEITEDMEYVYDAIKVIKKPSVYDGIGDIELLDPEDGRKIKLCEKLEDFSEIVVSFFVHRSEKSGTNPCTIDDDVTVCDLRGERVIACWPTSGKLRKIKIHNFRGIFPPHMPEYVSYINIYYKSNCLDISDVIWPINLKKLVINGMKKQCLPSTLPPNLEFLSVDKKYWDSYPKSLKTLCIGHYQSLIDTIPNELDCLYIGHNHASWNNTDILKNIDLSQKDIRNIRIRCPHGINKIKFPPELENLEIFPSRSAQLNMYIESLPENLICLEIDNMYSSIRDRETIIDLSLISGENLEKLVVKNFSKVLIPEKWPKNLEKLVIIGAYTVDGPTSLLEKWNWPENIRVLELDVGFLTGNIPDWLDSIEYLTIDITDKVLPKKWPPNLKILKISFSPKDSYVGNPEVLLDIPPTVKWIIHGGYCEELKTSSETEFESDFESCKDEHHKKIYQEHLKKYKSRIILEKNLNKYQEIMLGQY